MSLRDRIVALEFRSSPNPAPCVLIAPRAEDSAEDWADFETEVAEMKEQSRPLLIL